MERKLRPPVCVRDRHASGAAPFSRGGTEKALVMRQLREHDAKLRIYASAISMAAGALRDHCLKCVHFCNMASALAGDGRKREAERMLLMAGLSVNQAAPKTRQEEPLADMAGSTLNYRPREETPGTGQEEPLADMAGRLDSMILVARGYLELGKVQEAQEILDDVSPRMQTELFSSLERIWTMGEEERSRSVSSCWQAALSMMEAQVGAGRCNDGWDIISLFGDYCPKTESPEIRFARALAGDGQPEYAKDVLEGTGSSGPMLAAWLEAMTEVALAYHNAGQSDYARELLSGVKRESKTVGGWERVQLLRKLFGAYHALGDIRDRGGVLDDISTCVGMLSLEAQGRNASPVMAAEGTIMVASLYRESGFAFEMIDGTLKYVEEYCASYIPPSTLSAAYSESGMLNDAIRIMYSIPLGTPEGVNEVILCVGPLAHAYCRQGEPGRALEGIDLVHQLIKKYPWEELAPDDAAARNRAMFRSARHFAEAAACIESRQPGAEELKPLLSPNLAQADLEAIGAMLTLKQIRELPMGLATDEMKETMRMARKSLTALYPPDMI